MPFLDRPGAEIYFEVVGQGPPIVFAHGLGGNHLSWWQQVPVFAVEWTCVVFAARGFSPSHLYEPMPADASMVDRFVGDLGALIDELQLAEVTLVAQSLGGWACLEYTLEHPDRVRSLVLADTTGTVTPDVDTDPADSEALFARGIHPACGLRMFEEQPEKHWLYRSIDALSVGLDKRSLLAGLAASRNRAVTDVAGLDLPVLGIAGAEDIVIAPEAVRSLVNSLPRGRYEEVPAAGHSVYFERPSQFNRIVQDFLTG
ncbi:MAG TPA: alpha/beta hydrolase [Acidimicrobiales bacterium]|jgi:3-oxoadipate enol-lactonase|nr:alpha/beta hydrolase [Acidimicrobiales bacterium]